MVSRLSSEAYLERKEHFYRATFCVIEFLSNFFPEIVLAFVQVHTEYS